MEKVYCKVKRNSDYLIQLHHFWSFSAKFFPLHQLTFSKSAAYQRLNLLGMVCLPVPFFAGASASGNKLLPYRMVFLPEIKAKLLLLKLT